MITMIKKIQISNYDDIQNAKKILDNYNHGLDKKQVCALDNCKWSVKNNIVSFEDFSIKHKVDDSRVIKVYLDCYKTEYFITVENKVDDKTLTEGVVKANTYLVVYEQYQHALKLIKKLNNCSKGSNEYNKTQNRLLKITREAKFKLYEQAKLEPTKLKEAELKRNTHPLALAWKEAKIVRKENQIKAIIKTKIANNEDFTDEECREYMELIVRQNKSLKNV